MANQEQLDILKQGVQVWNEWRGDNPQIQIDLSYANLNDADLRDADLHGHWLVDRGHDYLLKADLNHANLSGAKLTNADLRNADLSHANLRYADLYSANLYGADLSAARLGMANLRCTDLSLANLSDANLYNADLGKAYLSATRLIRASLIRANLYDAHLRDAYLSGAFLSGASVGQTVLGNVDMSVVKGLEAVEHRAPCTIGIDTIIRSQGKLPEIFLRKAGVLDSIIEAIPSLIGSLSPIDYYSCFISYSSKDEAFARRLYTDLQSNHVRCWFAPEDMKIGDRIRPRIDESIRMYDRLLLVLSEHSVSSTWVEFEVEAAMDKEQEGKPPILFPVRLDNTVMESRTAWAAHIKRTRHIGDFTHWKSYDDYEKAFSRLLRDLKAETQKIGSRNATTNDS